MPGIATWTPQKLNFLIFFCKSSYNVWHQRSPEELTKAIPKTVSFTSLLRLTPVDPVPVVIIERRKANHTSTKAELSHSLSAIISHYKQMFVAGL